MRIREDKWYDKSRAKWEEWERASGSRNRVRGEE
jgi:hypothetical protein